jgi:hypothetical protein
MFELFVALTLLAIFGILVAMGLWHKRQASDIWDKDRAARWETQATIEAGEVKEMVAAQNDIRARRGEPPLTDRDVRALAMTEQRRRLEKAKGERAARSRAKASRG